jgi:hypothetical protein
MVRLAWVCDDIPGICDVWSVMAEEEVDEWNMEFRSRLWSFCLRIVSNRLSGDSEGNHKKPDKYRLHQL